ncbi:DNA helicase-2 / ATP-dependent DNA helicase PcrA [Catalinimonas alkaloidigena]|uniref:DNA 3'-5' helicase n=1 Tax=Catalinimonas alkaloidigena TaxID=1075417 RepID=A0A1G9NDJ6_9BACT|nr:UvrD-helicase domain-containing protein [Catalinimonas alkaloidigena]SDL84530.1 DNA helicase-2 / ATP-dependent DNA helicase PcrA [Catalinimonas alkaloidigena]
MRLKLDSLNEPQREAVLHTEGPLMVIAGAGSGKTRVLIYRIAHLIEQSTDPFRIMALTFTNKAANEMRQRIEKMIGNEARNIWMGTFHSIFSRILRFEAERLNYPSNFTIYDTDDSKSLLRSIIREAALDDKVYKPNVVLGRISMAKNRLISWQTYINDPFYRADDEVAGRPEMGRLYKLYQQRCFKSGAMDFDDLLFNTNVLFRDHPDVLHKYQHRFRYLLVDEFQDTNVSQYLITKKLAAVHRNLCVVGDDAQSIYAFRGADIQNILNFEKDYPELKTVRLEQNYRSTRNIVEVANSLIKHNDRQLRKEVWTDNEQGDQIELIKASSDAEEARLVATSIFEDKMNGALRNQDFAILYRTNAQSRNVEEALRKMNIKYRIVGGLSFYQRKEIKDLLAYLRFVVNHNDEEALKRIINLPKRGIGDTTIAKLIVMANENDVSLWDIIGNIYTAMSGRTANSIDAFANLIKSFDLAMQTKNAFEVASQVARESGLLKELYEDKTPEGISRYENVQELLNAIKEFVDNPENEDKTLGTFLQTVSLLTSWEDDQNKDPDRVTLMTIHSAKGLEFRNVYVVGMEEDLFPSQMMLNSREDLEEERRLFYVAITRAEKKLTLSYALSRYRFGNIRSCEPSRFLQELDGQYLKVTRRFRTEEAAPRPTRFAAQFKRAGAPVKRIPVNGKSAHQPSANFRPSDPMRLKAGMTVEHPKFGFGTVSAVEVQGNDRKARINFQQHGEKTLLLSFAKLMIHE